MESTRRNVRVCVRCRPFIPVESRKGHTGDALHVSPAESSITLRTKKGSSESQRTYAYDTVFDERASQHDVFVRSGAQAIVHSVADGYHGTIFAYGQTSSGKTYTMEGYEYRHQSRGSEEPNVSFDVDATREGVMPQSIREIFGAVNARRQRTAEAAADGGGQQGEQFTIRVSYVQIYMEQIYDLLAPGGANVTRAGSQLVNGSQAANSRQRRLRWDRRRGFFAENLHTLECNKSQDALAALQSGVKNKIMAKHAQNEASSRSHCIFQVHIQRAAHSGAEDAGVHVDGASQQVNSTLSLVDLAGSERQAATGTVGKSLKESIEINTSLFVLRKVIQALATAQQPGRRGGSVSHVPYRDSKLTSLLKDSLGGNSNTLMIACLSPSDEYVDENNSTLEYASTAKRITNRAVVNEDANTRLIRKLRAQVVALKEQLAQAQTLAGIASGGNSRNNAVGGSGGPMSGRRSAAGRAGGGAVALSRQDEPSATAQQMQDGAADGFHPFDTDYGRHLGEKVVESVTLLKRMVETNTELRSTTETQAKQLSSAERSNIVLMEENGQLRERLAQLQQLLLSGGADPETVQTSLPSTSSRSAPSQRAISSAPRQTGVDPLQGAGLPPTPASARAAPPARVRNGSASAGPSNSDATHHRLDNSSKAWLDDKDSLASAMDVADQALAAAGLAGTGTSGGMKVGAGEMDPKLYAALYGPLPGSGGFGGALPSEQSYQHLEKASSLTSSLAGQATAMRNENNAMEARLHALTASMSGMLKSSDTNVGRTSVGYQSSRNSTGLREKGNQWAFSSDTRTIDSGIMLGSSGPIAGRRRQNPNRARHSASGGSRRDGGR